MRGAAGVLVVEPRPSSTPHAVAWQRLNMLATVPSMVTIMASGTLGVLLAVGVGAFAIVVGGIVITATLGGDDRSQLRTLLRHPVRTIFSEDEPDGDESVPDAGEVPVADE